MIKATCVLFVLLSHVLACEHVVDRIASTAGSYGASVKQQYATSAGVVCARLPVVYPYISLADLEQFHMVLWEGSSDMAAIYQPETRSFVPVDERVVPGTAHQCQTDSRRAGMLMLPESSETASLRLLHSLRLACAGSELPGVVSGAALSLLRTGLEGLWRETKFQYSLLPTSSSTGLFGDAITTTDMELLDLIDMSHMEWHLTPSIDTLESMAERLASSLSTRVTFAATEEWVEALVLDITCWARTMSMLQWMALVQESLANQSVGTFVETVGQREELVIHAIESLIPSSSIKMQTALRCLSLGLNSYATPYNASLPSSMRDLSQCSRTTPVATFHMEDAMDMHEGGSISVVQVDSQTDSSSFTIVQLPSAASSCEQTRRGTAKGPVSARTQRQIITTETSCPAGMYFSDGICREAPVGSYATGDGVLRLCHNAPDDVTFYTQSGVATENCPFECVDSFTYATESGCQAVPIGQYYGDGALHWCTSSAPAKTFRFCSAGEGTDNCRVKLLSSGVVELSNQLSLEQPVTFRASVQLPTTPDASEAAVNLLTLCNATSCAWEWNLIHNGDLWQAVFACEGGPEASDTVVLADIHASEQPVSIAVSMRYDERAVELYEDERLVLTSYFRRPATVQPDLMAGTLSSSFLFRSANGTRALELRPLPPLLRGLEVSNDVSSLRSVRLSCEGDLEWSFLHQSCVTTCPDGLTRDAQGTCKCGGAHFAAWRVPPSSESRFIVRVVSLDPNRPLGLSSVHVTSATGDELAPANCVRPSSASTTIECLSEEPGSVQTSPGLQEWIEFVFETRGDEVLIDAVRLQTFASNGTASIASRVQAILSIPGDPPVESLIGEGSYDSSGAIQFQDRTHLLGAGGGRPSPLIGCVSCPQGTHLQPGASASMSSSCVCDDGLIRVHLGCATSLGSSPSAIVSPAAPAELDARDGTVTVRVDGEHGESLTVHVMVVMRSEESGEGMWAVSDTVTIAKSDLPFALNLTTLAAVHHVPLSSLARGSAEVQVHTTQTQYVPSTTDVFTFAFFLSLPQPLLTASAPVNATTNAAFVRITVSSSDESFCRATLDGSEVTESSPRVSNGELVVSNPYAQVEASTTVTVRCYPLLSAASHLRPSPPSVATVRFAASEPPVAVAPPASPLANGTVADQGLLSVCDGDEILCITFAALVILAVFVALFSLAAILFIIKRTQ